LHGKLVNPPPPTLPILDLSYSGGFFVYYHTAQIPEHATAHVHIRDGKTEYKERKEKKKREWVTSATPQNAIICLLAFLSRVHLLAGLEEAPTEEEDWAKERERDGNLRFCTIVNNEINLHIRFVRQWGPIVDFASFGTCASRWNF